MLDHRESDNNLKALRIAHGYTQDFVASSLEIARQTYSHYETGRRNPPYDVMLRLASLYEISLDELSNNYKIETGKTTESSKMSGFTEFYNDPENRQKYKYLTNSEKQLVYYFKHIKENYRWELIEFAKILASKL